MKERSKEIGTDEVFQAALIGGLAGAVSGIGLYSFFNSLQSGKDVLFDIDWQGAAQLSKYKNLNLLKKETKA